ncbi:hypothetical protein M885DRAFT_604849 [Pelagophyceae sp. CCMP2097]|nr:hypothetical protein M885DRAFT_604849 [Pelagophyceae sp. CCMP2097]
MKRGAWAKDPSWRPMLDVASLAIEALRRHCGKREEKYKTVSARQVGLHVARDATTEGKIIMVPYSEHVIPRYARLDAELQKFPQYTPVLVDDSYYDDSAAGPGGSMSAFDGGRKRRFVFRNQLILSQHASTFAYTPGGSHRQLLWVWTRPHADRIVDGDRTAEARLLLALHSDMPVYDTCAMNSEAESKFRHLPGLAPQIARSMRRAFSSGASASLTAAEADQENRLFEYMSLGGDSGIYIDLRKLNQRPESFDAFWEFVNLWINDALHPAVDDRRHQQRQGPVMNASKAMSIRDMISQVKVAWREENTTELAVPTCVDDSCLKIRILRGRLPSTVVPSESLVAAAFYPGHPCHKVAKRYSGKLNIVRALQQRGLHAESVDSHYNHAEQKYGKAQVCDLRDGIELEIRSGHLVGSLGDYMAVYHMDDKCGVKIGEAGCPIDTGVRRRSTGPIVPTTSTTSEVQTKGKATAGGGQRGPRGKGPRALDHDYHKATLVPAVSLCGKIPEVPNGSWCQGDVTITLNDATFELSTGWRHGAELAFDLICKATEAHNRCCSPKDHVAMITSLSEYGGLPEAVKGRIPKIVFINSDGGCDHNFKHLQVLCSIIALQRFLGISLITVRLSLGRATRPAGAARREWRRSLCRRIRVKPKPAP